MDDTGLALTAEYGAPSAGLPPWHVYRLTPRTATALATVAPRRRDAVAILGSPNLFGLSCRMPLGEILCKEYVNNVSGCDDVAIALEMGPALPHEITFIPDDQ